MRKENKMKQFKTVRGHVGYLCKLEGGKSEAKIHDAIQILNHHYDVVLEKMVNYEDVNENDISEMMKGRTVFFGVDTADMFMKAAAKRWLKKNKQTKRSKQK